MQAASEQKLLLDSLAPLAGPVVALIAIWAVHSLTKSRDREKAVFELYKTVGDAVATLKPIIVKAWADEAPETRRAAVAETIWRLQQVGGFVERIRRQSRRWAFRGIRTPRRLRAIPYAMPDENSFWRAAEIGRARMSTCWHFVIPWLRHFAWPFGWTIEIRLTKSMAQLRDAITEDPFNDPGRGPDPGRNEFVELAVGGFLQSMDESLFIWMDSGRAD